ncbi:hypothetical protein RQP46_003888 [Phenoliferia psychrophenolica]
MTSLALPAPTNGAPAPESAPAPAKAADDFLDVILPPPEIRSIVDRTAAFVAKSPNPDTFEEKIRAREKTDSRFAFLNKTDAYHPYYQHRLEAFRGGAVLEAKAAEASTAEPEKEDEGPPKPPALEFLVENPPSMNAVDLDILRLTALFTARSGRRFTSDLATRENRNYQFDFLRPSHSLFGYFNRLTEQYTKILIPSKETLARLERRSGGTGDGESKHGEERDVEGRREVLIDAKVRVAYDTWEKSKRQELEDQQEAERIAFAEIDWKDFVVVSTVEFTEADEAGLVELPPPMSLSEVENMTIAQKKMAAMIMEGREDEVAEDERERERGEEAEMEMDEDDDDDAPAPSAVAEAALEKERQRVVEIRTADSSGPMKIRKDYVPKAKRTKEKVQEYTTFNGQQVPVEEFADHVRIELLDPKWKEAQRQSEVNRSSANLLPQGTDVSSSIRALALHRPDIFGTADDAEERKRQEELKAKSKAREAEVWDGHTASKDGTQARFQQGANLDEQIEALHRAKGLIDANNGEPRIGPSAPAPQAPEQPKSFIPALSGASISAAPQANLTNPYAGYQQQQPAGYGAPMQNYQQQQPLPPTPFSAGPAIAGLPARPPVANPGEPLPPAPASFSAGRPADDGPDGEPSAKRQRVPDRVDGTYYPEEEWLASHPNPITIMIQLPDYPAKPEWGCNGTIIAIDQVPLTLLVGGLRDRITMKCGLPIGKQKLMFKSRILANSTTLASLNFDEGDEITVQIKDAKKK